MRLKVDTPVVNLGGQQMKESGTEAPLTLKHIIQIALTQDGRNEQLSGAEKVSRWELALRVEPLDEAEFSIDELAKISKLIGEKLPTQIAGQSIGLIEMAGKAN